MFDTYKMISRVSVRDFENMELNDVTLQFQNSKDKNFRNKCFVYVFKNVYPMLLKIHHKPRYAILSNEEKTEECICRTLFAMEHWKPDGGQKISSYIYLAVESSLKTLVTKANNSKNKIFRNLLHMTPKVSEYILGSIPYNSSEKLFHYIDDLNKSSILTKDEILYCQNILKGHRTVNEIAWEMIPKVDQSSKFRGKNKKLVSKPIKTEQDIIKYVGNLRTSIKKKLKENNNSPF